MNFRTQVELPKEETEIRHSDRIMLFGSCFAENIGNLLLANKFRCDVNPFGILYNPLSVAEAIRQTLSYKTYNEADLFCDRAGWHSFMKIAGKFHINFRIIIVCKSFRQKIDKSAHPAVAKRRTSALKLRIQRRLHDSGDLILAV